MTQAFVSAVDPPELECDEPAWWFVFRGNEILVIEDFDPANGCIPMSVTFADLSLDSMRQNYLGSLQGRHSYAVEVHPETEPAAGMSFNGLRSLFGRVPEDVFALAGRAVQILEWDRTHQFCGRCGAKTDYARGERAKRCPDCALLSFPRLSPAIIVLVERDDKILLARGVGFAPGVYSVLAGFVEPGESLEDAVRREVREEVGIELCDLRYFGSQPWPFPHSLMIGFTARHAAGEIEIDNREIADAGWYSYPDLPSIPQKISISRHLIDSYIERHGPPLDRP
jgi:NAD+ diphosphatase